MNSVDKQVIATLKKAKVFLQKNKWCRNEFAKDKQGNYVSITSKRAVSFCAVGAIRKVTGGDTLQTQNTRDAVHAVEKEISIKKKLYELSSDLTYYNDRVAKGKRDIINIFDRTIKRLSATKKA